LPICENSARAGSMKCSAARRAMAATYNRARRRCAGQGP
jgi:hypothetical protein